MPVYKCVKKTATHTAFYSSSIYIIVLSVCLIVLFKNDSCRMMNFRNKES